MVSQYRIFAEITGFPVQLTVLALVPLKVQAHGISNREKRKVMGQKLNF